MGKPAETQISLFENELESMAKLGMVAERSAAGQIFLSTKGGILTYRDQPISGNAIDVVILASPVERLYYMERYDAANPAPPVCYAIGPSMSGLKPNPSSPKVQSEFCANCPKDQWGSALNGGKGKGCAEKRRLLIMTADSLTTADAVQKSEVAALRTPVTSVKGFATYLQTVSAATKRPLSAVITKISLVPDSKTQFKLKFDFVKAIDDLDLVKALIARGQRELENAVISEVVEEPSAPSAAAASSSKY
jgi:hypothetical protein